jgi:hypothetical protein
MRSRQRDRRQQQGPDAGAAPISLAPLAADPLTISSVVMVAALRFAA